MALHLNLNRANGGIWDPQLHARTRLEDYDAAMEELTGFIPIKTGEAQAMTGFEFIGEFKNVNLPPRLFGFQFNASDSAVIEFGQEYMRVWTTGATPGPKVKTSATAWLTATGYVVGDFRDESSVIYYCIEDHTSGTFATDLAADKWVAQTHIEVPHGITQGELIDVQFDQLNDTIIVSHENHEPLVITRLTEEVWTIEEEQIDYPPLLDQNKTKSTTMYSSVQTGSGTLLASSGVFNTDSPSKHIGAVFALNHKRAGTSEALELADPVGTGTGSGGFPLSEIFSSSIKINGSYSIETDQFWYGNLTLYTSPDDSVWTALRSWRSKSNLNISDKFDSDEDLYYRLGFVLEGWEYGADVFQGTAPSDFTRAHATLTSDESIVTGIAEITAVASSTSATATVLSDYPIELTGSGNATYKWQEGAWSDYRGFPKSSTIFEQRIIKGGTRLNPTKIWASRINDLGWYKLGDLDDDAWTRSIAQDQNEIVWMDSMKRILLGTSGSEYAISSTNQEEAITPRNVTLKRQSRNGSASLNAIPVGDSVLYTTRDRSQIREMFFSIQSEGYKSRDVSELAKSVMEDGIIDWTFQQNPNKIVWMITTTLKMIGLVFDKENEIVAFFRRETAPGHFLLNLCTVYGAPGIFKNNKYDEFWVTSIRGNVGCIERLGDPSPDKEYQRFLDSYKEYTFLGSDSITGLPDSHNGQTVQILNDGKFQPDQVVTGNALTLDSVSNTNVVIGLKYPAQGITLPLEAPTGDGASRGKMKSVSNIVVGARSSVQGLIGIKYTDNDGIEGTNTDRIEPFGSDSLMGEGPELKTRSHSVDTTVSDAREIQVVFERDTPHPMHISYMIPRTTTKGN